MSLLFSNVSSKIRTACNLFSTSVSNTVVSIDAIFGNITQSATTISANITYYISPFTWVTTIHNSGWLQQLQNLNWSSLRSVYQNSYRENGRLESSILCLFLTVLHPVENNSWTAFQDFVLHIRNAGWSYYNDEVKLPPFVVDLVKLISEMGLRSCYVKLLMLYINFTKSLTFESVLITDLLNPDSPIYPTRQIGQSFISCIDIPSIQAAYPGSFDTSSNIITTSTDTIEVWDIQNYANSNWNVRIREICSFISYEEHPIQTGVITNTNFYEPFDPGLTSTPCAQGRTTVFDGTTALINNIPGYVLTNFSGATKAEIALISGTFIKWDITYTSTRSNAVSPLNFIQRLSTPQLNTVRANGPDIVLVNPLMGFPTPESQELGYKTLVSKAREESRSNTRTPKNKRTPQLNQPRPTATSAAAEENMSSNNDDPTLGVDLN